ncbi:helix-turn-helix domain-containing protein [Microbacterium oxydans]|uniref:helix-turn-helix domain-containing protein n=1 Tax=Microbacterium oxydans TaxID=82380 RepID=UPI00366E51B9
MSVESIAVALHHSRATGAAKLVLIGIANHDGDGGAWPSVATLAKYAGVDPRSARRAVEQLEKLHEVKREIQAGGDRRTADHARPNLYRFLLRCPANCDRSSKHRLLDSYVPVELSFDPRTPESAPDARVRGPRTPKSPEPSLNHPSISKNKSSVPERARAACGHELIDDRHCERGCRLAVTAESAS